MSNEMPLNINLDLSQTKTTIPMIADNTIVRVRVANISQTSKEGKDTLVFEYHLLDPAPTTEGLIVSPGFKIYDRVQLYAKDGAKNPQWFMEKLAKIEDAVLGTGDAGNKKGKPARPPFNAETVAMMIGQTVILTLKVKTGEYEGNEVSKYTFPGDIAA